MFHDLKSILKRWLQGPYSFIDKNEFIISAPISSIRAFVGKLPNSSAFQNYCTEINLWLVENSLNTIPCIGYNQNELRELL